MTIEKNGKVYEVVESERAWTLSTKVGSVPVQYSVSKTDCPTVGELKAFVAECSALLAGETHTYIKFLSEYGSIFHTYGKIEVGTVYSGNEFIKIFGCEAYDDIRDSFCDCSEEERAGKVEMWQNGMHIEVWDE